MSVNYYALGKTNWHAIRLEDFGGARGAKLNGLDQLGPVYLETDRIYDDLCRRVYGEYRFVYWPVQLLVLFMDRFGAENPDGVEFWAADCLFEFDEPKPGSFGWASGNHGRSLDYIYFRDMWDIADKYVPELREPEHMRNIFGELYEDYVKALVEERATATFKNQSLSEAPKKFSVWSAIRAKVTR